MHRTPGTADRRANSLGDDTLRVRGRGRIDERPAPGLDLLGGGGGRVHPELHGRCEHERRVPGRRHCRPPWGLDLEQPNRAPWVAAAALPPVPAPPGPGAAIFAWAPPWSCLRGWSVTPTDSSDPGNTASGAPRT